MDAPEEAGGHALETLLLQNLAAVNDGLRLGYSIHYWRASNGTEVDFVLYGPRGHFAFEVKRKGRVDGADTSGLRSFLSDYPKARAILAYGGPRRIRIGPVDAWPVRDLLLGLPGLLAGGPAPVP